MKNLFIIFFISLLSFSALSQNQSVFDKFEDYDDVTTVVVTKKAFQMLTKITSDSEEAQEFKKLVSGLENLKVFTTSKPSIAAEMQVTFNKYLKSSKLSELMRVKDKDANVKIYVKEGRDEDHVSEFLMLVDEMDVQISRDGEDASPQVVIISFTGDIDLNNISKITSGMDIPGGEHMKIVHKK